MMIQQHHLYQDAIYYSPESSATFYRWLQPALRSTAIIKKNPMHGFEPGKDWMLYKPLK